VLPWRNAWFGGLMPLIDKRRSSASLYPTSKLLLLRSFFGEVHSRPWTSIRSRCLKWRPSQLAELLPKSSARSINIAREFILLAYGNPGWDRFAHVLSQTIWEVKMHRLLTDGIQWNDPRNTIQFKKPQIQSIAASQGSIALSTSQHYLKLVNKSTSSNY
jgi:hypothetical protein